MRSKCSQKRGLPCHPMPVNHLPTKEGEAKEAKEVRVDSAWGPCASSPLGPGALHTTPGAPHLCPTSTHPVPSSWLSLSPYTSAYITSRTYALPPNIHAWQFAGQGFTPINFQFRAGGLTIQRLRPSFRPFDQKVPCSMLLLDWQLQYVWGWNSIHVCSHVCFRMHFQRCLEAWFACYAHCCSSQSCSWGQKPSN